MQYFWQNECDCGMLRKNYKYHTMNYQFSIIKKPRAVFNFEKFEPSRTEELQAQKNKNVNPEIWWEDIDDPSKKNLEEKQKKSEYDGSHAHKIEVQNREKETTEQKKEPPEELLKEYFWDWFDSIKTENPASAAWEAQKAENIWERQMS